MKLLLAVVLCVRSYAFPVDTVSLTQAELSAMQTGSGTARQQLATSKVLSSLRLFFNQTAHAIQVDTTDVLIQQQFPDEQVDNDCHHKITAEHPLVTGTIANTSYLQFGASHIGWQSVSVFAEAKVDATLGIDAAVKVWVGEKILGHCDKIGQKTVGVNVVSTGHNGIGLNFTASNAHVEKSTLAAKSGFDLVFDFEADVVGLVLDWDVDDITVHNCKIEILGIKIGSYCSLIKNAISKGITKLTTDVSTVVAPNLLKKLQVAVDTAIGSTIRIPIQLP